MSTTAQRKVDSVVQTLRELADGVQSDEQFEAHLRSFINKDGIREIVINVQLCSTRQPPGLDEIAVIHTRQPSGLELDE